LAAETPTSSAPMSPGPTVQAIVDPGLDHRPGDDRVQEVQVGAAGDLRHDAAVRDVQVDLRADDARHDVAPAHHERRGGLVAARLDAEHERVRTDLAVDVDEPVGSCVGHDDRRRPARRAAYSGAWMSWHHMTIASSLC
jgi:hypothetical protein